MKTLGFGSLSIIVGCGLAWVGSAGCDAISQDSPVTLDVGADEVPDRAADEQQQFGMRLAGFDEEVARRNGYEIVTLPDGGRASVPRDKAEAARAGDYRPSEGVLYESAQEEDDDATYYIDYRDGDCGTSFVGLWAMGSAQALLETGFDISVNAAVWDLNWNVRIQDNGGTSNQHYNEFDGTNLGYLWQSEYRLLGLTRGWANATVVWWNSWAVLTNGWLCYSLGPSTAELIN
jgi:hypothetical protein